jgi:hypothetical protein
MKHLHFRLRFFLAALILIMIFGSVGFMHTENLSLLDAFYFNIVTITTVGYGDIHPVTPTGKMLAVALILMGTGTFLGVIANATEIMLSRHESQARHRKLHLIIGIYFSEVGTRFLSLCTQADPQRDQFCSGLAITTNWTDQQFSQARKTIRDCPFHVELDRIDLPELQGFLAARRHTLVTLLENPILLEHENFTEHLQAVFHLNEELGARPGFDDLPPPDRKHLTGDINRAYGSLVGQWLSYMLYLKQHYPYLYSLSVRTNPFNPEASATLYE